MTLALPGLSIQEPLELLRWKFGLWPNGGVLSGDELARKRGDHLVARRVTPR